MSRFFSPYYSDLKAYVPGEQPKHATYIKLNTNESPYLPPLEIGDAVKEVCNTLPLYPDPECITLREHLANLYNLSAEEVFVANGSDDILNFAFMAFVDPGVGAAFADITYGFYKVFADLHHLPYKTIPLLDDFSIDVNSFCASKETIFIANPNAPTGMVLDLSKIELILQSNRDRMVVIDEAYVDFGAQSCLPLLKKYDNLLIIRTFSKSRSLAGARLGYAFASSDIINELNTIKYSTNPYNVNRLTMAAANEILKHEDLIQSNCKKIIQTREKCLAEFRVMGFFATDSYANFIFVRHPQLSGEKLYLLLKERNILIRHFEGERISDFNRISIGKEEDMNILCSVVREILSKEISYERS